MTHTPKLIAALLIAAVSCLPLRAAESIDMRKRTTELQSLRWGMFICWSFSTFSGKEWTPGVKDISFFKATECDTDQWARTAKEAGMGYILFLTKHHDGFCLWDTKTTERKVTKAPLGRDVLAELRKSCDKHGIKLAIYFSEGEFGDHKDYHPGGYTPEMKKAQLKELLTQYGPLEYIWFDTAQTDGGVNHDDTVKWCKQFQPGCFIGFNHRPPAGDIRLGEMGQPSPLTDLRGVGPNAGHMQGYTGYLLAEFTYPILPDHQGGAQWFYSLPEHDNLCRPAAKLYADYLGAVKYGNIFSIDLGPDYRGRLRDIDVATLRQVGELIRNPPPTAADALSRGKKASASGTWAQAGYEADKAVDGETSTRWGLEVDLGQPQRVGRAVISELQYPRTRQFAVEYLDGQTWKPLAKGTTIEGTKVLDFAPVTARQFRLNILEATEVPTIEEFGVYPPAKEGR
ncbi:MAG: alpha-L-fucosidase [Verrucomicrobia bacterium]|nr:alpha-L-fucosidase [Verrucomicrobiota bacterium]